MSLVGILAILSLSFGVEGWRFEAAKIVSSRTDFEYSGIQAYWSGIYIELAAFVMDSRSYTYRPVSVMSRESGKSMYRLSRIGDFGVGDVLGTFYMQPVTWNRLGSCTNSKSFYSERNSGRPEEFDGIFKIKNARIERNFFRGSDTFEVSPREFSNKCANVNAYARLRFRFDALKRLDGYVYGRIFCQQMLHTEWLKWETFGDCLSSVTPRQQKDIVFSKVAGNDGNLWRISEQEVKKGVLARMKAAGYLVPRSNHGSCLADSLGGWYYEACGDFPASPILEYKSVAVKQQSGQKITPWGRMTWEARGKKTGWFLPRGQHFLPRVFRTDKAPKVDDFWATPPKGVP